MKLKRLSAGDYYYRGFRIEKQDCGRWFLGEGGCDDYLVEWCDSEETLRECKATIDRYYNLPTQ
ncbi:hypothetical protein N9L75_03795 [Porticoccaceae bacterium]|nr:hypothetical protein [Porticoccaceae bacterium]MDA8651679.1 hypothetical protein [Porticoccaceae bacterium]MDA8682072.1 hypothetical protein [Porticoccaceae bacterium]MDB2343090.1 hypothetical protein [Porticoccaceae bacterium]MDB2486879.1 hypothetical protein [Porticoccaceae bacterium]